MWKNRKISRCTVSALYDEKILLGLCTLIAFTFFSGCASQQIANVTPTEEQSNTAPNFAYPAIETLQDAPQLHVSIQTEALQRVTAIQGVTNWTFIDADGMEVSVLSDSLHSLQHSQENLRTVTLYLHDELNEIEFEFCTPPQSVSVIRWNEAYVDTLDSEEPENESVSVGLNGSTISINNDGYAYIYEARAMWEQGSSYYTFRTEPYSLP